MKFIALILLLTFSSASMASGYGRFGGNHYLFGGAGYGYGFGYGAGGDGYGGAGGTGGNSFISTPRFAMTAVAPPIQATIPCALSMSSAGQGLTFGFSAGLTYKDKECNGREGLRSITGLFVAGLLEPKVAKSMAMDTVCSLPAITVSRECRIHNQARMDEDGTDGQGFGENQSANFQALLPWNWFR